MSSFWTVISVSALVLLTACASPGGQANASDTSAAAGAHASHHPGTTAPMPGMQDQMKAMRDIHDKMMNAKTPAEREALMAQHMNAMQGGMDMMKRMGCMGPMGGMAGGDMAQRQQAMEGCAQMMQTMMDMMGQRMPNAPASK